MKNEAINADLSVEPVAVVSDEAMAQLHHEYPGIRAGISAARAALENLIRSGAATAPEDL